MLSIIKDYLSNKSVSINAEGLTQEQLLEAAYDEFKKVNTPITDFPISRLKLNEHNGETFIMLKPGVKGRVVATKNGEIKISTTKNLVSPDDIDYVRTFEVTTNPDEFEE